MIESVYLKNFKKFKSTDVRVKPFTVLMGENSSGKTTVLQALNFALTALHEGDYLEPHDDSVRIRSKGVSYSALPGLELADYRELYYGKHFSGGRGGGQVAAKVEVTDTAGNSYRMRITSQFGGYNVRLDSKLEDVAHTPKLQMHRPLFISGYVGLPANEERLFPVAMDERLRFGQVSNILRNLVLELQQRNLDAYAFLCGELISEFDFDLSDVFYNTQKDRYVTAHYSEQVDGKDTTFDFGSSGSGLLQILQILVPIYRYCPDEAKVVLLDEPDAHLHPNLQAGLAKILMSTRDRLNIQIIISTHSTAIIRAASPQAVVPVTSAEAELKALTSSEDIEDTIVERIDNYSLAKSVLSRRIVFCEDRYWNLLAQADRVLKTSCFTGKRTTPLLAGRGRDDKVPYSLKPVLKQYVNKDVELHVVRDRDGLSDEWVQRMIDDGVKHDVEIHVLNRFEAENYIIDPTVLRRAIIDRYDDEKLKDVGEHLNDMVATALRDTIRLADFEYSQQLEETIYKTSLLLSDDTYRNPTERTRAQRQ